MSSQFPHGYALLIGVGQSAYPKLSLPVTVQDVQAIRALLIDPELCGYPDDAQHIRLLHDKGATKQAILDGLAWLQERAQSDPEATVVVYYSGHGWLDPAGRYYLIPHDIDAFDLNASALPAADLTTALRQIEAQRLLVFMDCCHAAGMATAKDAPALTLPEGYTQTALPKALVDELKQGAGRAVFTSSLGTQKSWVRPDGSLSIYTYHLLEALRGAGNQPGDKVVNVSSLMNHLGRRVPESAQKLCQAEQTPFFDLAAEDFPIAVLRGGKGLPAGGWEAVKDEAVAPQPVEQHITEASGERAVAIGRGDGNVVMTGDHGTVQQGKYNIRMDRAEGVAIGDHSQVVQGDQVQGDKAGRDIVHGDRISARDISGTAGLGRGAQVHVQQGISADEVAQLFARIYREIEARPAPPDVEKEEITEAVQQIEQEVAQGEQAKPKKVERWLRFLVEMAPDIGDIVIKTLTNPLAGIVEVVRKVAARVQAERAGQAGV